MAGAHFTIDTIDTSGLRQIQERVQVMAFQSTPAIADGRIQLTHAATATCGGFQSTPAIADGRIRSHQ